MSRWKRPRRWALAAAAAAAVVAILAGRVDPEPPVKSIAVLPFNDMSESQDQAYLADGFAEEILDKLNQSTDLRVIARTSSFALRGKDLGVAEIARKLQVTHVLEGSVRKSGDNSARDRAAHLDRRQLASLVEHFRAQAGRPVRDSGRDCDGRRIGAASHAQLEELLRGKFQAWKPTTS